MGEGAQTLRAARSDSRAAPRLPTATRTDLRLAPARRGQSLRPAIPSLNPPRAAGGLGEGGRGEGCPASGGPGRWWAGGILGLGIGPYR